MITAPMMKPACALLIMREPIMVPMGWPVTMPPPSKESVPHSLGIAIMCLVLIIRICLLPLFFSQMRATQRMQVLQPQIQRIQRKYAARKDPRSKEAMQREIMALQQRHNANPLGSYLLR